MVVVNNCGGESEADRELVEGGERALLEREDDAAAFTLVFSVCVFPLKIDISSAFSLALDGRKISLGILGGIPLLVS